ncbi:hypothetical protein BDQ17DRAFT_1424195 [Cyathus striatus]|nr:hypothetical protein BDQ17DRAFT_1424195 [Cyathus striatus]
MDNNAYKNILNAFMVNNIKVSCFILFLLSDPILENDISDLQACASTLITTLIKSTTKLVDINWLFPIVFKELQNEVKALIFNGDEWKICAMKLQAQQLHEFHIDKMAKKFASKAPQLWSLLNYLLSAGGQAIKDGPVTFKDDEGTWADMDLEGMIEFITTEGKSMPENRNESQ